MKWLNGYRMRLMFVGFIAAIVLGSIELANGATIAVGPGRGYDFGTIQAGIDAANGGDTVLVAPGEYVITEPITFRGNAITVRSEAGPDQTTIRMGTPADTYRGSIIIFENNETKDSILEGFTLTGGRGSRVSSLTSTSLTGGGILFDASSATVRNCAIVQNTTRHGGGVFCVHPCTPTLIDCIMSANMAATSSGGGAFSYLGSSLTLTNCAILDNSATEFGGGVFCYDSSSVTMADCIIRGNSTTGAIPYEAGYGGGLCCTENSSLELANCTLSGNSAGVSGGAAMCARNASVNMANCIVTENSATRIGSVMFCETGSSATFTNCVINANSAAGDGGAVHCWSSALLTVANCTITGNSAANDAGAIRCSSGCSGTVTNSIILGNTTTTGREISLVSGSTLGVTYSNITGGQAGVDVQSGCTLNWDTGNIDADPYFADPANDDYHLKSEAGRWDSNSQSWVQDAVTSPCIDAGDPMSPINIEPFPNGGFVNMGAYGSTPEASKSYFGEPVCETIVAGDINGDCQVNRAGLEIMALHWTDEEPLPLP